MRISDNGIALIKRWEGLELKSYQDIAGIWTIGYGHTETAGPNQQITEREAEELLARDLRPREKAVSELTKVPLNQNEFDALVSFVYNVGINAYKGSTARKRLNSGDRPGAADALTWWNKATINGVLQVSRGLSNRRADEKALFLRPANPPIVSDPTNVTENSRLTPVEDSPRRNSLGDSRTLQGSTVAGGAGIAASSMGKESAEELDARAAREAENTVIVPVPRDETAAEKTGADGVSVEDAPVSGSPESEPSPVEEIAASPPPAAPVAEAPPPGSAPIVVDEDGAPVDLDPAERMETIETVTYRPTKEEKYQAEAQIQFALQILIVLAVLYVVLARFDDWLKYRR